MRKATYPVSIFCRGVRHGQDLLLVALSGGLRQYHELTPQMEIGFIHRTKDNELSDLDRLVQTRWRRQLTERHELAHRLMPQSVGDGYRFLPANQTSFEPPKDLHP